MTARRAATAVLIVPLLWGTKGAAEPSLSACSTVSVELSRASLFPEPAEIAALLELQPSDASTAHVRVRIAGPTRSPVHATDEPFLFAADEAVTAEYSFWDGRGSFPVLSKSFPTEKTVRGAVASQPSPWTKARAKRLIEKDLRQAVSVAKKHRTAQVRVELAQEQSAWVAVRADSFGDWQSLGEVTGPTTVDCLPPSGDIWFRLSDETSSVRLERTLSLRPGEQRLDASELTPRGEPDVVPSASGTKGAAGADGVDPHDVDPPDPPRRPLPWPLVFAVLGGLALVGGGAAWAFRRSFRGRRQVFLSYRRDDVAAETGRLHDWLAQQPIGRVFMDVVRPSPAEDYRQRLLDELTRATLVIVCIGPRWLAPGPNGRPRLFEPNDWVRFEIATALRTGKRTMPLLFETARMPSADELPDDLKELAYLHAAGPVRSAHFNSDVALLREQILRVGVTLAKQ